MLKDALAFTSVILLPSPGLVKHFSKKAKNFFGFPEDRTYGIVLYCK